MKRSRNSRPTASLYAPLDFFQLRAPLLSTEVYKTLTLAPERQCLVPSDARICRALAVGSPSLLEALSRTQTSSQNVKSVRSKLLRYMIRMSTRPTPYGLFAGVALGYWGDRTDLELAVPSCRFQIRPDMQWLMRLVLKLESNPEVRKHLCLLANPAAIIRAGRIFLDERVSVGEAFTPPAVSLRATNVVRRALLMARAPIPYGRMVADLLENTESATPEKIDRLLTELWKQTLLLTDLRPPLTIESPAQYVVNRLAGIPAATKIRVKLKSLLESAAAWGTAPLDGSVERYRSLTSKASELVRLEGSPFQVDMAFELQAHTIRRAIGEEVARAAELLLRMGPLPQGSPHIAAYRSAFVRRYGVDREVPLLELLDANFGLGPPTAYSTGRYAPVVGMSHTKSLQRGHVLLNLALMALRERITEINLDEQAQKHLETWPITSANAPQSLDLYVSVGAASRGLLDAGDFEVVLGPNVGALSAGRSLGRFAGLLGIKGREALALAAECEESHSTETLWAELSYQPRQFRSANVSIRPNVRRYEIALGVGRGSSGARVIPLDELVVGVRDNRFCLRWPAAGRRIVVTGGHMLNYLRAPNVCRFLAEVSRDGCCQLSGFNWGPASQFPFLPRVRVGRIVLAPAQWQITTATRATELPSDASFYRQSLDRWRDSWKVPQYVYLSSGDNRLLLDLCDPWQAEELRRSIQRLREGNAIQVTEVLPAIERAWLRDAEGSHFMSELVVSLTLRKTADQVASTGVPTGDDGVIAPGLQTAKFVSVDTRLRLPGSDWLFAKLYVGRAFEDELIAGSLRRFAEEAVGSGMAREWSFLRYSDPDNHIRLRFHGPPERLKKELLPSMCNWVADLNQKVVHALCC
jgi:hypothetical protein